MKTRAFIAVALLCLAASATAFAASGKMSVKTGTYDPDKTGTIVSAWQAKVGLPDAGNSNHGLVMQKNAPTPTNAAAVAIAEGVEGEGAQKFGFDVKGYCGAGSPRFNVYTDDNPSTMDDESAVAHFLGCSYGTHAPNVPAPGWDRVTFTPEQALPPIPSGTTIQSVYLVADEQGQSVLDNIVVNNHTAGKPGSN